MLPPPAETIPYTPIALARSRGSRNCDTASDRATADATTRQRPALPAPPAGTPAQWPDRKRARPGSTQPSPP